jgi:flagellar motor protein MotB
MRQSFRQRSVEEEEESVFVSMTDMTVSFLFIVMILLAFFASQIAPKASIPQELVDEKNAQIAQLLEELRIYRDEGDDFIPKLQDKNARMERRIRELEKPLSEIFYELKVNNADDAIQKIVQLKAEINRLLLLVANTQNKIEQYNTMVSRRRAEILTNLRQRIAEADPTIEVSISRNHDALQFKGDGLFASGASIPSQQGRAKMRLIAGIIQDVIACFSLGDLSTLADSCNEQVAIIDALQIEGHADSDGLDIINMVLSAKRGASIYREMVSENPALLSFTNLRGQPILSVAGYGEGRPIADETLPGGKDSNRRIDIRFIMFSPTDEESIPASINDLERIRDLLVIGESR